ncbi:MAG: polysaccharide deacetylase family protein [Burkholderiales bacterium]|nr:polysaccharide deacetylase family protein [Burkholderiales bacterium]
MATDLLTVVQCWDDGVTADVRLTEILRRHDAKATFNLNAGLHEPHRKARWIYQGQEVARLGWDEMRDVYAGFAIANHSLTHPYLDQMPEQAARREIVEGRDRLEQFFGQQVHGFVYPFGRYNDSVMNAVREAGHVYARTADSAERAFPPHDAMAFHPSCHFLAPDFWARYEKARAGGVFYFWGHAYEISTNAMWTAFEDAIAGISADPAARWADVVELFER